MGMAWSWNTVWRCCRRLPGLAAFVAAVGLASLLEAGPDEEEQFVVIKAGRVITMAGAEQRDVDILLVDGKIRLVGKSLSYPKSARVIDARREVVMPGLIHPRTRWQLPSYRRSGVHGDRSADREVYLSELDFEPFLEAGFTSVCFYPDGTGIPGPATVYRTAGAEKRRQLGNGYLRVTMSSPGRDKKVLRDAVSKARKEIEKVEKARKEWEEKQKKAQADAAKKEKVEGDKDEGDKPDNGDDGDKQQTRAGTSAADEKEEKETPQKEAAEKDSAAKKPEKFVPPKIDPAVLPIVEWIRDKKGPPLLYELSESSDYRHLEDVLEQADELPLSQVYVAASYYSDLHHVLPDLAERKMRVLLEPRIGSLPYTVTRFHVPAELVAAGCQIAMLPARDSETGLKEHRLQVAALVRAGLPRDEALKAVTLRVAELLGMDDRLGSIEKGKDADLIFLDGDPLAPDTNVTRVMAFGDIVWEAP